MQRSWTILGYFSGRVDGGHNKHTHVRVDRLLAKILPRDFQDMKP
jgi:hypothetical protein